MKRIKARIEETTSDYHARSCRSGLAKLSGGVAVIKVGGVTETEVKEAQGPRRRCAARNSRGGRGGHCAGRRRRSAARHQGPRKSEDRQRGPGSDGITIVRKACRRPARRIYQNAGEDGSVVVGKGLENANYAFGYNAQSGRYGDLVAEGVIDPTKVVRCALQDAASVAGLLVAAEAMIADLPKKDFGPGPSADGRRHERNRLLVHLLRRKWKDFGSLPRFFFLSRCRLLP